MGSCTTLENADVQTESEEFGSNDSDVRCIEEKDTSPWCPTPEKQDDGDDILSESVNVLDQSPFRNDTILKEYYEIGLNTDHVGTAIIFNHENFECNAKTRPGTSKDCDDLQKVLEIMKFQVKTFQDLTYDEIMVEIRKASQVKNEKLWCIMIIVMSHGKNNILSAKDKYYKAENLWNPFKEENCSTWAKKPKIFILQACQGIEMDAGLSVRSQMDSVDYSDYDFYSSPDFLIVYSTVPLYVSWRKPDNGSRMIQELVKIMTEHGEKQDILTILTLVNQRVSINYPGSSEGKKQVMRIHSTLTQLLVLQKKSSCLIV